MNNKILNFKPQPISVELDGKTYNLCFNLNAFCEMEKLYDSVDEVLQMLLGGGDDIPDLTRVTYCEAPCLATDISIAGVPLAVYIEKYSKKIREAKHEDTRNLLWLGCLHEYTEFDSEGNIVRYTLGKGELAKHITLRNMREINTKIVTALLQDLIPATNGTDPNVETVETPEVPVQE